MKKFFILSVLFLMLLLAGCTNTQQGTNSVASSKTPIKLAMNVWPGYAHAFIAQKQGFFTKNGVEVQLILTKDYSEAQALYASGSVDAIFEVYADRIFKNAQGIQGKVVYIADKSTTGDSIVGGSEFNSLADLKGKKIGVDGINTFSHIFILMDLEKAGLSESDVYFENVPASEVPDALASGKISAGHTWDPYKSTALNNGYKVLGNAEDVGSVISDVLTFNPTLITQRPEDVQAVVKSLFEARDYIATNEPNALEIMASAENMSVADMKAGLKGVHQPNIEQNIEMMKKTSKVDSLYVSGNSINEFYLDRGQILKKQDLSIIIEPKFVNSLKQN